MTAAPSQSPVRTFLRLLGYAAPDGVRLVGVGALALLGAAFELARPWPVKLVIDQVLGGRPMAPGLAAVAALLPGTDTSSGVLAWCIVAAVTVTIGASALSYVVLTAVVSISQRMVYALSRELFARLQRLSLAFHGRHNVGDLFVFLGYLTALFGPVNSLSSGLGYAVATATRGRRVFEILDSREEVQERRDAVAVGRLHGSVVFDDVTFGYGVEEDGARAVLRDVSLRAEPGQVIAIVGATGAGKSSMVALLSRFYDPWNGRVLVDGRDVRELTLSSLRENVSLVLQEPFLFPMSVADNIAFGRPDATRSEIEAVARLAQADEFIRRLPEGYDTVLSEKGTSLSGGERQRIAIARALLKDAPILILDEPTSALDAHAESKIFEALSELMRGRTTFVISHRLSTICKADQILAIEHGRIVERETHDRLLAESEVYSRLYRHEHIAVL